MGFSQLLAKLFGTKSQRDLKEIMPYIDKVKAIEPTIQNLTNDELRARLQTIRADIQGRGAQLKSEIDALKANIEQTDLTEREKLYAEVDKREKEIMPYVDKVKTLSPSIQSLSDNELRDRLQAIRADIQSRGNEQTERIAALKEQIEQTELT